MRQLKSEIPISENLCYTDKRGEEQCVALKSKIPTSSGLCHVISVPACLLRGNLQTYTRDMHYLGSEVIALVFVLCVNINRSVVQLNIKRGRGAKKSAVKLCVGFGLKERKGE